MLFKFWNELNGGRLLLEEALELEPSNVSALWFLGQLYVKQKCIELGVQTFETVCRVGMLFLNQMVILTLCFKLSLV